MVHDRIAAGEAAVVPTAAVLRCGKQMGKTTTLQLSCAVSLQRHSVWKRLWTCRETEMNYYYYPPWIQRLSFSYVVSALVVVEEIRLPCIQRFWFCFVLCVQSF
jgi:hypothetical protein